MNRERIGNGGKKENRKEMINRMKIKENKQKREREERWKRKIRERREKIGRIIMNWWKEGNIEMKCTYTKKREGWEEKGEREGDNWDDKQGNEGGRKTNIEEKKMKLN